MAGFFKGKNMTGERGERPLISLDSGAKSPIFNGDQAKSLLQKLQFSPRESAQIKAEAQRAVIAKTAK